MFEEYLTSKIVAERDKLLAFKQYGHNRLDAAGVPADPESTHKAEGCRIGGRLDELIGERDRLRADVDKLQRMVGGFADRIAKQSELLSRKAEAGSRP